MATISPAPFQGARALSKQELLQRAKAVNCTLAKSTKPACSGQVDVGIFFDGTGNNMNEDFTKLAPASRKHSNVVKLFRAHEKNADEGRFAYYVPGVGTPFPLVDDFLGSMAGGAFAWNGESRIIWAFTQLLNAPKFYVLNELLFDDNKAAEFARRLASSFTPPAIRRSALRHWQGQLKASIKGKKPHIELINLTVYGFSRGAAEARAFCNWLFEVCESENGVWLFAGIPIRVGFLGIFDTVASVGIPNSLANATVEGHQSWADNNMTIHPAVEQCVHFVAGHEVRAAFPLDSVRDKNTYPANAREVMYPGSHSDLGGGYAPNDLGIAPAANEGICVIPGAQMYNDARLAGAPMTPWGRLDAVTRADFIASAATVKDFNAYVQATNFGQGSVESLHRKHMSMYLSYRYKYRNRVDLMPFYRRAKPKHQAYLRFTSGTINRRLSAMFSYAVAPTSEAHVAADAVRSERKRLSLIGTKPQNELDLRAAALCDLVENFDIKRLTPEIETFYGHHIHDSMAGFIEMGGWTQTTNEFWLNGLGIMKYRKIFKGDD